MPGFSKAGEVSLAVGRIGMGWLFLWPFLDKAFGLGFSTAKDNAWVRGGSPTEGFLKFGTDPDGILHGMFEAMAGNFVVDALFMLGLLGIGVALLLGVGMRIAAASGITLLVLMWLAVMPMDKSADHNPFWDDHLQYAAFLAILLWTGSGRYYGLADRWKSMRIVQQNRWLE